MTVEDLIRRLRWKADQAWDMAGLAALDGDAADAKRRTDEAQEYERQIREIKGE